MRYAIDIIDSGGARTAVMTGLVSARLREKVNDIAVLSVETADRGKWELLAPGTTFLRLRTDGAGQLSTFRVIETSIRREREKRRYAATARAVLADTAGEIFAGAADFHNHTPAELMARVLEHSAFDTGDVEPTAVVPYVRFEYEPVWDCLQKICSLTGGELSLDEEAGSVSLLSRVGSDGGAVLRYGLNLAGASRSVGTGRLANRVYGVGGGDPLLLLTSATSSAGKTYIEDTESVARWGLREAVCHEPMLEDVENLVFTPAFDGEYTSGLCVGWTKTSASAAASRSDDPALRLYGTASQKVETSADGDGICQTVAVTAGKVYSLVANLFIESGTVRVRIVDGGAVYRRAEPVTGSGLVTVRIENWKANSGTVLVELVQEGAGTAVFYADSVQIAGGAAAKAFTVGKTADTLMERAREFLDARSEPDISYEVDLALTGTGDIGLGDTVRVIDSSLGIDTVTRVMERDADLLAADGLVVRLDTASRTMADVIAALREAQDEGVRRMRAAMAGSSTAAETGSLRLGFSRQAFRFYGAITASGWNSIGWSAGTFRAGDAYYSVSAGSATGLAGNSTYHFYFDRTAPSTFGCTALEANAEGEDRIHAFSVTTTSSPNLCRIHPLGIIHV